MLINVLKAANSPYFCRARMYNPPPKFVVGGLQLKPSEEGGLKKSFIFCFVPKRMFFLRISVASVICMILQCQKSVWECDVNF